MVLQIFKQTTIEWFGGYDYYRINYMLYILCGVWMLDTKYVGEPRRRILLCARLIILVLNILAILALMYDTYLQRQNIEKLTYSLSTSIFYVGSVCRFIILILQKDELEQCLKILDNNFYFEDVGRSDRDVGILKAGEAELRGISKKFYFLVTISILSRGVCQLAPAKKNLMIPFPFIEPVESPHFEILFVIQTVCVIHFIMTVITHEMVVYGIFIRIVNHTQIVKKNIYQIRSFFVEEGDWKENQRRLAFASLKRMDMICRRFSFGSEFGSITTKYQNDKIEIELKKIIAHHQSIVKIVGRLNNVYQYSFFLQLFWGGVLLANLFMDVKWKSKALSASTISQGLYAGATFLNISLLCHFGSRMEEMGNHAATALYQSPWLQMNTKNRKKLVLFMSGLAWDWQVKAGHVWAVNLKTYVKFVQLIYTCITFIQSMMGRNQWFQVSNSLEEQH